MDICETKFFTRLSWWYPVSSIVNSPVSSSSRWAVRKWVLKLIQFLDCIHPIPGLYCILELPCPVDYVAGYIICLYLVVQGYIYLSVF